jgi:hypothetical protein
MIHTPSTGVGCEPHNRAVGQRATIQRLQVLSPRFALALNFSGQVSTALAKFGAPVEVRAFQR